MLCMCAQMINYFEQQIVVQNILNWLMEQNKAYHFFQYWFPIYAILIVMSEIR